jgi:hypothetical protein
MIVAQQFTARECQNPGRSMVKDDLNAEDAKVFAKGCREMPSFAYLCEKPPRPLRLRNLYLKLTFEVLTHTLNRWAIFNRLLNADPGADFSGKALEL